MRMKDKVALISGAASGMGAATARLFPGDLDQAAVLKPGEHLGDGDSLLVDI